MTGSETNISFEELGVSSELCVVLRDLGYEMPTPIQAKCIPALLSGGNVLGQAQTGTGKTAAFALPLLSMLHLKTRKPQVLVLTPTRELAIQVSEAFQAYARKLKGFDVLPIFGGQPMGRQLSQLKRGPQVIVGTPGRVMDHLRRGTLRLDGLNAVVLDEADEMLKMGFIEDVEWILEQCPENKQVALFSATMPKQIRAIAKKHLKRAEEIHIRSTTQTVELVDQFYWQIGGVHKLDALTRILELEDYQGVLIFVRTRAATVELSEKLRARGHSSAPLNGDMNQRDRERTVQRLKDAHLNIVVATDVAARGLDVERISHVVNYDIPYDAEAYVHRIGRTGRAGRSGKAILFVAPRERRLLKAIERSTRASIKPLRLPTRDELLAHRITGLKGDILQSMNGKNLESQTRMVEELMEEEGVSALEVAAALAQIIGQQKSHPPLEIPRSEQAEGKRPRKHNKQGRGRGGFRGRQKGRDGRSSQQRGRHRQNRRRSSL